MAEIRKVTISIIERCPVCNGVGEVEPNADLNEKMHRDGLADGVWEMNHEKRLAWEDAWLGRHGLNTLDELDPWECEGCEGKGERHYQREITLAELAKLLSEVKPT